MKRCLLVLIAGWVGAVYADGAGDQSISNLKQIGLAIAMYADVHDDHLPDMSSPKAMMNSLSAYLGDYPHVFVHPQTGESYQPNRRMNGKKWQDDPDAVVCFEATSFEDTRAVLFNDGHVLRMPEAQWQALRKQQDIPEGDFERRSKQLSNLDRLGRAILEYAKDGDKTLPPINNLAATKKVLLAYTGMKDVFIQPDNQEPYVANPALSGKKLAGVPDPGKIVIFYESKSTNDTRGVLYLDGKVDRVPESRWPDLKRQSGIK